MAKEYIEREAAVDSMNVPNLHRGVTDALQSILRDIPAADVVEVKHGKWEQKEVFAAKGHVDELQSAFCPVCQRYHTTPYSYYFTHYNYCPNCGARMDGDGEELVGKVEQLDEVVNNPYKLEE